ncbi:MAG: cation diffusion facilitator family transporter [Solirubrobacteraceae bacterium]
MTPLAELPVVRVALSSTAIPTSEALERERLVSRAKALSWLSLGWMAVEGAVAITAALIAGSVALLGFGIDSVIEALASVIVIWRFTGGRRASEHAEERAQKLVAISFFLLAPYLAQEAVRALISSARPSASWVGIGLSLSSIVIMPLLGHTKQRIGQRLGSAATAGEGAQNRLCAYMAAGVMVGLLGNAVLGAWWLDPVIALAIAALAVHEGRETWRGEGCCAPSPTAADGGPACCEDPGCAG